MIDEGAVGASGAADRDEELGDAAGVNGTSGDVSFVSCFVGGGVGQTNLEHCNIWQ